MECKADHWFSHPKDIDQLQVEQDLIRDFLLGADGVSTVEKPSEGVGKVAELADAVVEKKGDSARAETPFAVSPLVFSCVFDLLTQPLLFG